MAQQSDLSTLPPCGRFQAMPFNLVVGTLPGAFGNRQLGYVDALVIGLLPEWQFQRELDPATGYDELRITPSDQG